jgi:threonine synthase
MKIKCSECGKEFSFGTLGRCPGCEGILQPVYSDQSILGLKDIPRGEGIDRYRSLMPVSTPIPFLGEGNTPLVPSRRIGPGFGLNHLYFKLEGCNPTGAFKDRGASIVAALALEAGAKGVVTASSGNAGAAIAAFSAAVGLPCLLLLEPGAPPAKLRQALTTGAKVLSVEGVFSHGPKASGDLIVEIALALNYYPGFIWAPVNPYPLEAMKTISYEVVNQLSACPEVVVSPVGGGDLLTGQWRGYLELKRAGVITQLPRMVGVQSSSAPPLVEAFRKGLKRIETLPYANSKISGINVPFSGEHALQAIRASEGTVVGVPDQDVFDMQRRLALEEGIWVEPASVASVTALRSLVEQGWIKPHERVVCLLTGAGFKDSKLAEAEAEAISRQSPVPFDVEGIVAEVRKYKSPPTPLF